MELLIFDFLKKKLLKLNEYTSIFFHFSGYHFRGYVVVGLFFVFGLYVNIV